MPKKQEGQLYYRAGLGWYGRFYAMVEGERIRVARALKTENRAVARRRLTKMIAEGNISAEEARRPETFEEAATRLVAEQKAAGMVTWKDRERRLKKYILPRLGPLDPKAIRVAHIKALLEEVRDMGKARQSLIHIKNDISVVLNDLWQSEVLEQNIADRVNVPEALPAITKRSKKARATLGDDELGRYLAWRHPDPSHAMAVLERQTMSCVSRMFGGLRTSDLHTVRWETLDPGEFVRGVAPRAKGGTLDHGGEPQELLIPAELRPFLIEWWTLAGKPTQGLVFPKRRGKGAGERGRKKSSHAERLRIDLMRAFGIEAQVTKEKTRSNGRRLTWKVWEVVRAMTPRERLLFEETEFTKPVDFHSWRRRFAQALADAGVNAQQAKDLTGHSSDEHERYLRRTAAALTIPAAALPRLDGHKRLGTLSDSSRIATDPLPANDSENARECSPIAVGGGNPKPALYQVEVHPEACFRLPTWRPRKLWAPRVPERSLTSPRNVFRLRFLRQPDVRFRVPAGVPVRVAAIKAAVGVPS